MEENQLVNPEKFKKVKRTTISTSEENEVSSGKQPVVIENKNNSEKFINRGSTVKITLESGGRFGNPRDLTFRDYTAKQINDLVTTKEDDLLETLVVILNECVVEPVGFDCSKLTSEEFYEVLLGMKLAFDGILLKFKWIHDCQDNVPDKQKKLSETDIDLSDIDFKSIEFVDEKLKEIYKARLGEYSEDQFQDYVKTRYGHLIPTTIQEEVSKVQVREPFLIKGYDQDYEFNFMRIGNLIRAYKKASSEFDGKIRMEKNKSLHGVSKDQMVILREEAIEKLNLQKARCAIRYAQAFCLHSVRTGINVKVLTSDEEKISEYNSMPRSTMLNYMKAVEIVEYGVTHEIELECDLCQGTERRSLQRWVNPFQLLPLPDDKKFNSTGNIRDNKQFDFYF